MTWTKQLTTLLQPQNLAELRCFKVPLL